MYVQQRGLAPGWMFNIVYLALVVSIDFVKRIGYIRLVFSRHTHTQRRETDKQQRRKKKVTCLVFITCSSGMYLTRVSVPASRLIDIFRLCSTKISILFLSYQLDIYLSIFFFSFSYFLSPSKHNQSLKLNRLSIADLGVQHSKVQVSVVFFLPSSRRGLSFSFFLSFFYPGFSRTLCVFMIVLSYGLQSRWLFWWFCYGTREEGGGGREKERRAREKGRVVNRSTPIRLFSRLLSRWWRINQHLKEVAAKKWPCPSVALDSILQTVATPHITLHYHRLPRI